MKRQGNHPKNNCPLYSEFIQSFAALAGLPLPSAHTVLLIVADCSNVRTDIIGDVAEHLLASGLRYVCVWGPDCERVHDIFEEVEVGDGSSELDWQLMSTWHADESLDEALWYFAVPEERDVLTTSFVAVTVGMPEWAASVERTCATLAFRARPPSSGHVSPLRSSHS